MTGNISMKFPEGVFEGLPQWHNKSKVGTISGVAISIAVIIGQRKWKSTWLDIIPKANPGVQSRVATGSPLQSPSLLRGENSEVY